MPNDCVATLSISDIERIQDWWDAACCRGEEYGCEDDPDDVALADRLGLRTLPTESRL